MRARWHSSIPSLQQTPSKVPTEAALQDKDSTDCPEVGGSKCLGPLVTPPVDRDDRSGTGRGGEKGGREGEAQKYNIK